MNNTHQSTIYFSNSEVDIFENGFVFKRYDACLFIPFESVKKIRLVIKKNLLVSWTLLALAVLFLCKAYWLDTSLLSLITSIFMGALALVCSFIHPIKTRKMRIRSSVFVGEFKIAKADIEDYKDALRVIVKVLKTKNKKAVESIAFMEL